MSIKIVDIGLLKPNPSNPRHIKDGKFTQLVKSIRNFPEMLNLRPIVVDADYVVLGGNMRLKACIEAGLVEVPIIIASELTKEQQSEFIIKDNVGFGEWDWEELANAWEIDELSEWGLDIPLEVFDEEDESETPDSYTKNITLTYSIEEAERIESELYNIASTLEQAVQILLQK
jgi:ParB-like chromosome segregation protein Spo0J